MWKHNICIPEHNMIYLAIPKCATSSIKRSLGRVLGLAEPSEENNWCQKDEYWGPYLMSDEEVLWARKYNHTRIVAVIRDPIERIVSCWRSKVIGRDPKVLPNLHGMPFDQFVRMAIHYDSIWDEPHITPQYRFLYHRGEPLFTKLINIRNLGNWWPFKEPLEIHNVSSGPLPTITPNILSLLKRAYAADKELLLWT